MTVDELAARAGVTVRTIRFYAGRGLLPPPRLRGRTGLYGEEHLSRLELVRELQSLGLTLNAIERYLERIPLDAPPEDIALQRAMLAPWAHEEPEELDRHELARRAGHHIDDETLKRLAALGVVEEISADRVRLLGPTLLGIGAELARLPVPLEMLEAAHQVVERYATSLAEELHQVFQDTVVRPYRERGRPPAEKDLLLAIAAKLKPLTIQALVTSFQRAADRAIRGAGSAQPAASALGVSALGVSAPGASAPGASEASPGAPAGSAQNDL